MAKSVYIVTKNQAYGIVVLCNLQTMSTPMKLNQLLGSFDQAMGWNALLYGVYKFLTTLLTLILYSKLSTQDFSIYANVQSIIFILLLWLDCGFKKSIARFCPEYAQNNNALRSFITRIICFKVMVLVCAMPLCIFALDYLVIDVHLQQYHMTLLAITIFAVEGMVSLLQLIYQAHFWHKYFNLLSSTVLALQMISNCIVAYYSSSSIDILLAVFYSKIAGGVIIGIISCIMLIHLYAQRIKQTQSDIVNVDRINRSFVKHSAIMWTSNNLKSLTERNVMVPLLTLVLGQSQANIFKVANDSALFFYRIILKTIGSTDTALLSHAKIHKMNLEYIFNHLHKKITMLSCGLFTLFMIILAGKCHAQLDMNIIQLFAFITICYLIEVMLSPYERILEVDQEYAYLFKAYTPYIVLLAVLFLTHAISTMGLLITVIVIHTTRIISALLIKQYANQKYAQKASLDTQVVPLTQMVNK